MLNYFSIINLILKYLISNQNTDIMFKKKLEFRLIGYWNFD